ncbi:MAG: hypothetical protein JSW64_10945 [Candidatus Zixiibacteriota bacterium]|nr:MAG: hypothetical protein JSW64_10945 [candidate division Zixibacteria bacterium]
MKIWLIGSGKILVVFMLLTKATIAEYNNSEVLVIPWGQGTNELNIEEPYLDAVYVTEDSTRDKLFPSGGPHFCFVDNNDNYYFASYLLSYLKGFRYNGQEFLDFSTGHSEHDTSVFLGGTTNIFVDSDGIIYIGSNRPFATMTNENGEFLGRLNPLGEESDEPSDLIFYNFDGEIIFDTWYHGLYKYKNGEFTEGGYDAWKASDGYYYDGWIQDESSFLFIKFQEVESVDTFYVSFDGALLSGGLLGIDENDQFFMQISESPDTISSILVYDNNFTEIDRFELLPQLENQYLWYVHNSPFLRGDGNVYQFLCEDDGMHVIKWSKE